MRWAARPVTMIGERPGAKRLDYNGPKGSTPVNFTGLLTASSVLYRAVRGELDKIR